MRPAERRDSRMDEERDLELVAALRRGDLDAFGQLFERQRGRMLAVARTACRNEADAEDAVHEAFHRMLTAIQNGAGPTTSVSAYLRRATLTVAWRAKPGREREASTEELLEIGACDRLIEDMDESTLVADAFAQLPARWRFVLWQMEVEGRPLEEVAATLGIQRAAAAALRYRAREALRVAYLCTQVLQTPESKRHLATRVIAGYVRGSGSASGRRRAASHLDGCGTCRGRHDEMDAANAHLRPLLKATA